MSSVIGRARRRQRREAAAARRPMGMAPPLYSFDDDVSSKPQQELAKHLVRDRQAIDELQSAVEMLDVEWGTLCAAGLLHLPAAGRLRPGPTAVSGLAVIT